MTIHIEKSGDYTLTCFIEGREDITISTQTLNENYRKNYTSIDDFFNDEDTENLQEDIKKVILLVLGLLQ